MIRTRNILTTLLFAFFVIAEASFAAGSIVTQTVAYTIPAVYEISVTGAPSLTIVPPAAGDQLAEVTDSTAKYAITTNGSGMKITGKLAAAMPTGITLKINLTAPSVGASVGDVTFTAATAVDLVTGITQIAESNLGITYKMSATLDAVAVSSNMVVTLTITDTANTVFP